jgi:hypothetical protein
VPSKRVSEPYLSLPLSPVTERRNGKEYSRKNSVVQMSVAEREIVTLRL